MMAHNMSADSVVPFPDVIEIRPGEIWQQKNGVYMLQSCSPGHLLINTTTETQECKECEYGTFSLEPLLGCGERRCGARQCIQCPVGVVCNKGSALPETHFVPKPLDLLGEVVPFVIVILPEVTIRYHCNKEYYTGTPGCLAVHRLPAIEAQFAEEVGPCVDDDTFADSEGNDCTVWTANPTWCLGSPEDGVYDPPWEYADENGVDATMACCTCKPYSQKSNSSLKGDDNRDSHLWEYDRDVPGFLLKSCPPGHQLLNSSDAAVFNPILQRCRPCGGTSYIIDREMPCQECPKGADCPGFISFHTSPADAGCCTTIECAGCCTAIQCAFCAFHRHMI